MEEHSQKDRDWLPAVTIEHLWIALPVVMVLAMGFRHKLRVLDFWWHLKIGEIIVETRSIPRTDLFSFTTEGKIFLLQNWLSEAFYYLVYQLGGLELLIVANTFVLLGALLFIYHLCWDSLRRVRPAVLTAGIAVISLSSFYSNVRPQTVSFLFFSIFYWVLLRYSRNQPSFPWILPPLMALWVNLHGAFVLGLGLIGLFLFSETLRRLTLGEQRGTLATSKLKALLLVFLVTVLASLINPETYGVYDYVLTVLRDPGSQLYVSEWQPPKIKSISGIACFYGPFFFSLLVILYSDRRLKLTEFLLYFGFAAFALTSLRNGIWFSLITAPIIASAWNELRVSQALEQSTLYRSWQNSHDRAEQSRKPASLLNYAIAFSMFIGCILSSPWLHPAITGQPLWEEATPVGAVDFIEEKQLEGNIFHAQAYGDYLIWRLWPRQKSFVDGRVHLFGEELVKDYMSIFRDSCWEQRLEPYDIRYLFLRVSNESDQILHNKAKESPHWELLYEDKLSVILEKTTP